MNPFLIIFGHNFALAFDCAFDCAFACAFAAAAADAEGAFRVRGGLLAAVRAAVLALLGVAAAAVLALFVAAAAVLGLLGAGEPREALLPSRPALAGLPAGPSRADDRCRLLPAPLTFLGLDDDFRRATASESCLPRVPGERRFILQSIPSQCALSPGRTPRGLMCCSYELQQRFWQRRRFSAVEFGLAHDSR